MRTFYIWLTKQNYRNDEVGHLAHFIIQSELPEKTTKSHLLSHCASDSKERARDLLKAWREYKELRKLMLK